jgi:hypothetical protein
MVVQTWLQKNKIKKNEKRKKKKEKSQTNSYVINQSYEFVGTTW